MLRKYSRQSYRTSPRRLHRLGWLTALGVMAPLTLCVAQDSASVTRDSTGAVEASSAVRDTLSKEPLPKTHTVKKGDTLWDLAQYYLRDPFLWPGIFRLNTDVVEDPHWIYPGEVLRIAPVDNVAAVPTMDTPVPQAGGDSSSLVADSSRGSGSDSTDALARGPQQPSMAETEDANPGPLFPERKPQPVSEILKSYTHQPYRPLRRSEFYSSGFLTENQSLPYGRVIGPVTPQQIKAVNSRANALPFSSIALEAPGGASYAVGDSLLLLQVSGEIDPYGNVIVPTGVAVVTQTVDGHYVANVTSTYGPIRNGQRTLPLERFNSGAGAHAVPVNDGVRGALVGGLGRQDLKEPQMVVFINKGREDGVAPGDLFEVRRRPGRTSDGLVRVNELMATMQIVHVRDHTATGLLLNVISPDIPPGTDVMQVAKLPQ
jgi:LysM domain-containing protein